MIQQPSIAYKCLNAIGNSLELDDMLTEVITAFLIHSGAVGGKYTLPSPLRQSIANVGEDFAIPEKLTNKIYTYEIHLLPDNGYLLDIPIENEHFLFLFKHNTELDILGNMFSNFRIKLTHAIDACRSVESLHRLNSALKNEVAQEKNKNKATEKLLISQSRMAIMGEMIGMIAHQWRQPITIIGMITNNTIIDLQIDEFDKERCLEDLHLIDKQVHYLSRTIDDFRNFTRPNKLPQKVTFQEISHELIMILGKNFDDLIFESDTDIAIVTYKNELLQVFLNILSNAKDAFIDRKTKNPKILFQLKQEGDHAVFSIQDNGGGIPSNIIDRIFEPYFSTKSEKNGTGLGLYMSAIIVEKHLVGTLRVSSDKIGTTFTISIPIQHQKERHHVY
jgi:two-component system, NtrC family, C4-dicarboxylate transport sensor histidine kinase DctB